MDRFVKACQDQARGYAPKERLGLRGLNVHASLNMDRLMELVNVDDVRYIVVRWCQLRDNWAKAKSI
jgi:hypothetical protein